MFEPSRPPLANRPIAAAIAVMLRGDRVLLVRRGRPPDRDLWGFPGGKIEAGETIAAAALRELQEETGVTARARGVLTALDVFDRAADGTPGRHFVLIAVLCDWIAGDPVAADDAADARWFALDALAGLPLSRDVARVAQVARTFRAASGGAE